jgi:predicted RNase H-like HicB family nuclease
MRSEFTAIIEPHPNGVFTGYIAEVPDINTGGWTPEAVCAELAEKLRLTLEYERKHALSLASPRARIISIPVEWGTQSEAAARPETTAVSAPERSSSPGTDLQPRLMAELGITPIPPALDSEADDDFEPIPIEGRPISEEIIEDRR